MTDTFGFGTDTTGFSSTIHDHILKETVATLRAGLVSLPKGAVVPASIVGQRGENFTLRSTAYPDLVDTAFTTPLVEGVAPTALKLGIDTQDWTVTQDGARTVLTDLAMLQSPHDLKRIAGEKIARLAADRFDKYGRTALAALNSTNDYGEPLGTSNLLDMVTAAQAADLEPIPGVGYYAVLHPNALRGLTGESGLNGYVDVMAQANAGMLTKGAVGQYRGVTFLSSSKFTATNGVYPVYIISKGRADSRFEAHEDLFWSFEAKSFRPDFRIATVEEALRFAFEVEPHRAFELARGNLPFGAHAWAKYDRAFWEPQLLRDS